MGAVAERGAPLERGFEPAGPVGLAAGYDRDGSRIGDAGAWGFAFVELGTVTPLPVPDRNPGAAALAAALGRMRAAGTPAAAGPLVGANLGAQPGAAPAAAWRDYLHGLHVLWPVADFLVLNFTSDAAHALRAPSARRALPGFLAQVGEVRLQLAAESGRRVPVLVKWPVYPDWASAAELVQRIGAHGCDGVVAAFDADSPAGPPWEAWVPDACAALVRALSPAMTLVGVGGVDCVERALALHAAGAHLLEVYRGFAVQGPALVHAIDRALRSPGPRTRAGGLV